MKKYKLTLLVIFCISCILFTYNNFFPSQKIYSENHLRSFFGNFSKKDEILNFILDLQSGDITKFNQHLDDFEATGETVDTLKKNIIKGYYRSSLGDSYYSKDGNVRHAIIMDLYFDKNTTWHDKTSAMFVFYRDSKSSDSKWKIDWIYIGTHFNNQEK